MTYYTTDVDCLHKLSSRDHVGSIEHRSREARMKVSRLGQRKEQSTPHRDECASMKLVSAT